MYKNIKILGKQKSTFICKDLNQNIIVDFSFCDVEQKPIELVRSCNKQACLPVWEVSINIYKLIKSYSLLNSMNAPILVEGVFVLE